MPIVIDKDIPAYSILGAEKIVVMEKNRASTQDIRPIEIALLNLMPTKKETETQFMRLLSNSPLQVNITLIHTKTYHSKNTEAAYLDKFYKSFDDIKNRRFDGLIVTGAPVETMDFSDVVYWDELKRIFDFSRSNVTSTLFICWGAMAALNYFYDIPKHPLKEKLFGVFANQKLDADGLDPLMRGISDEFHVPHSRHSTIWREDVEKHPELKILGWSKRAGASIIASQDDTQVFVLGHMEYDRDTLKKEYERDLSKGLPIKKPVNYFADKECTKVKMNWTSTANIFYNNWLNHVYQITPYDLDDNCGFYGEYI
ncbi:MAG: homoserine O-succinyltransferase [Clostridia bacterium]|nr:homoserine O-succinyltransferase [Clostridia bacterium]